LSQIDFRSLFESAPGLYLVLDRDLRIVAVTETYLRATMTSRESILGRGIFEVFPDNPNDPAATGVRNLRASLLRVLATGMPDVMPVQKYDIQRPEAEGDGFEERYWSPINSPVAGATRAVEYIIHRVVDVTDYVKAREAGASMESEIYARSLEIAEINRRLRASNETLEQLHAQIGHLMAQADHELKAGPGEIATNVATATAEEMLDRVGKLITRSNHLQEQLRQSQKMDAIGRLAGGIAHDFNNLLTAIIGYNEMLTDNLRDHPDLLEFAAEVRLAAERASALTYQLLAFSRRQVVVAKLVDLNTCVSHIDKMLRRIIGEDIELTVHPAEDIGMIRADPSQIDQVILNLAVNARDAMPDGGRLILETAEVDLDDAYAGRHIGVRPGRYVMLAVSDTGHGMDETTKSKIFEPFFTTKDAGKGTGLGLSIVYGIVKQSGGDIMVYSEPGAGTVVKLYFPMAAGASEAQPAPEKAKARTRSSGTILLVEDEDQVRNLARVILEREGYRILPASGAEEALELVRDAKQPIDLLLTDIVMPRMRGTELAKAARDLRPALKVLFMSGYTDSGVRGALEEGAVLLQKPFTAAGLREKIRQVLGDAAARHCRP